MMLARPYATAPGPALPVLCRLFHWRHVVIEVKPLGDTTARDAVIAEAHLICTKCEAR